MDRPLGTFNGVADARAALGVHAGEPELGRARRLQIVPNRVAVVTEEFVSGNFVGHGALVHQLRFAAIDADGAIDIPERRIAELAREVIQSRSRADTFGPDGGEK